MTAQFLVGGIFLNMQNNTMKRFCTKFTVVLLLFMSSCNNTPPIPTSTSTSTVQPSPSSTLPTKEECPQAGIQSESKLVFPENAKALKALIRTYLNKGGDPVRLPEILADLSTTHRVIKLDLVPVDISGDGIDEILALADVYTHKDFYHESAVWLFKCSGGTYQEAEEIWGGVYDFNPNILSTEDLNGDKISEVVINMSFGGSGCLAEYFVIGWNNSKVVDYLDQDNMFYCWTELSIQDQDNDGQKELIFTGVEDIRHSILPDREFIYIYEISDMQTYRAVSKEYTSTPSRVYILVDAQNAMDKYPYGPPQYVTPLYTKAAYDETLQDHPSLEYYMNKNAQAHPKEYAAAFALFRLVTIYAAETIYADESKVDFFLEVLTNRFPKGTPGSEFVDIANLFVDERKAGKSPTIACSIVSIYIDQMYPNLARELYYPGVLHYESGTLCPY